MIALETATSLGTHRPRAARSWVVLDRTGQHASFSSLDADSGTAISGSHPSGCAFGTSVLGVPTGPGMELGRYQLIERLGQGCQGEVWRAFAIGEDGDDVALKLLPPALARDPKRLAQFHHEAERGARIAGPAVVTTYEVGEAGGILFMAMPLVDGCSLADIVSWRRGPTAIRSAPRLHRLAFEPEGEYLAGIVTVLARVARGLARVHASGVAHRDIKPANVLLDRRHDDEGFLCDFGLGRDLDIATPAQLRDGAGTPLYMAPERLLRQLADERLCDIFALGATLFEALALSPPRHVPEDLPWYSWHTYLAESRPSAPSTVRDAISPALDAIVLKAMACDPSRRYPTADDLADDLETIRVGPLRRTLAEAY